MTGLEHGRVRLRTAEEDERVLVEFGPREALADVPGRCNMTPKGRGWISGCPCWACSYHRGHGLAGKLPAEETGA